MRGGIGGVIIGGVDWGNFRRGWEPKGTRLGHSHRQGTRLGGGSTRLHGLEFTTNNALLQYTTVEKRF